jgi:hypothetical protein
MKQQMTLVGGEAGRAWPRGPELFHVDQAVVVTAVSR